MRATMRKKLNGKNTEQGRRNPPGTRPVCTGAARILGRGLEQTLGTRVSARIGCLRSEKRLHGAGVGGSGERHAVARRQCRAAWPGAAPVTANFTALFSI